MVTVLLKSSETGTNSSFMTPSARYSTISFLLRPSLVSGISPVIIVVTPVFLSSSRSVMRDIFARYLSLMNISKIDMESNTRRLAPTAFTAAIIFFDIS